MAKTVTRDLATLDELEIAARNLKAIRPRALDVLKHYDRSDRYVPLTAPAQALLDRDELVEMLIDAVVALKHSLERDPSLP